MKKIEHLYKNFNINKFLDKIDSSLALSKLQFKKTSTEDKNLSEGTLYGLTLFLKECVNDYNNLNNSNEDDFNVFLMDLIQTGEFFINIKQHFSINHYYLNSMVEDDYHFIQAYSVFCKKDLTHRLFCFEQVMSTANRYFALLDKISDYDVKRVKKNDKERGYYTITRREYHLPILNNYNQNYFDGKEQSYARESKWKPCGHFNLGKNFYKKWNKIALELEN